MHLCLAIVRHSSLTIVCSCIWLEKTDGSFATVNLQRIEIIGSSFHGGELPSECLNQLFYDKPISCSMALFKDL